MNLFIYENYKLTLNHPELLLVKEFRDIWESDNSKNKDVAHKMFTYLYLFCDWKSVYSNFLIEDKVKAATKDSGLTDEQVLSNLIENAKKKYLEILESNPKLGVIRDIRHSINSFRVYLRTVNFIDKIESGARKGDMLYSPKDYLSVIEKSNKIFEQIDYLEKTLKEELEKKEDIRGDQEDGYFNN